MIRIIVVVFFSLSIVFYTGCKPHFDHEITLHELEETVAFLASDSLKGRAPGTPEDSILTQFIIDKLDLSGMILLGSSGKQEVITEQGFTVTHNNKLYIGRNNPVVLEKNKLKVFGFSATDTVTGELIISLDIPPTEDANALSGNILTLPFPKDIPSGSYDTYLYLRSQCLEAADLGVNAVIYLYEDTIPSITSNKRLPLTIPVVALKYLDILVSPEVASFSRNETFLLKEKSVISSGIELTLESEVLPKKIPTYNTLAGLKGSNPALSHQYIIIGAHHDHLGFGGRGSSSRKQDTVAVHYGADDNASGVAGVIELSQHIMSRSPGRSFIFTTFAAEESGLLGSKEFTNNPPVDLKNVQAMINLDMIGRLNEERQLQIGGVGTSPIFKQLIDSLNLTYNFNIAYSDAGYGPSDHSSFYARDIPVLFVSTGAHTDYHTPEDHPGKINYSGMQEVLCFISDIAFSLSNITGDIEFTVAGPKEPSGSRGRDGMVTFGLMPDVMYDGNQGMPVSFVTEGKPAAVGGMKNGDIIKKVDGKTIGNVHDYMERLSELKEGQSVVVTVERNGELIDLLLKL
jgi:hypothetical protein